MVKVEVIEKFTLKKFHELKNLKRANKEHESSQYDGMLFVRDVFECGDEMAKYLTGENALNKTVVKAVEVKPEEEIIGSIEYDVDEKPVEVKVEIKKDKKKKSKK